MKKNIPNFFTILNLILGLLAISFLFQGLYTDLIIFMVYGCLLLDFMDGFIARKLNSTSAFGKQLDSLSDLVSFGVLPTLVIFLWIDANSSTPNLKYFSFLTMVCSAIRLAKFNVNDSNQLSFIGLPTPANAFFFISLIYYSSCYNLPFSLLGYCSFLSEALTDKILIFLIFLFSYLMISDIQFSSLKFKNYYFKDNLEAYFLIFITLFIFFSFGYELIFLIIVPYVLVSIFRSLIRLK